MKVSTVINRLAVSTMFLLYVLGSARGEETPAMLVTGDGVLQRTVIYEALPATPAYRNV